MAGTGITGMLITFVGGIILIMVLVIVLILYHKRQVERTSAPFPQVIQDAAVMAVHRMISLFPGEQQEEIRNQISQVLRAVICQRLLRWNKKFITIRDILLNTHAVANLIRTRKEPQIISIQETQLPMKTLEMAVRDVKAQYGAQQQLHTLLDQQLS